MERTSRVEEIDESSDRVIDPMKSQKKEKSRA